MGGCALAFVLVVLQMPLFYVVPSSLAFIGLTQAIYIIPLISFARSRGKKNLANGLIIGASILFMLNATCLGLALFGLVGSKLSQ